MGACQICQNMWDVEIISDLPGKGKGLFATRDFEERATLFEEKPLVSCQFLWNKLYQYRACDHCMQPLETAEENVRRLSNVPIVSLPHPDCCKTDKTVHTECP